MSNAIELAECRRAAKAPLLPGSASPAPVPPSAPDVSPECEQRLRQNLTALEATAPRLASAVRRAPRPEGEFCPSRDGLLTFRFAAPLELIAPIIGPIHKVPSRWLGACSTPRLMAETLLAPLTATPQSTILPSLLDGRAPLYLASRLPEPFALFVGVFETPATVRVILELFDYAPLITAGKLVLLAPEWEGAEKPLPVEPSSVALSTEPASFGDSLVAFFERNPGYLAPSRIVRLPQIAPRFFAAFEGEVRSAVGRIELLQIRRFARVQDRLAAPRLRPALGKRSPTAKATATKNIYFVSPRNDPTTMRRLREAVCAAQTLGHQAAFGGPFHPSSAHPLAWFPGPEATVPDTLIWLNGVEPIVAEKMSPDVTQAAWLLPETPARLVESAVTSTMPLFAGSKALLEKLDAIAPKSESRGPRRLLTPPLREAMADTADVSGIADTAHKGTAALTDVNATVKPQAGDRRNRILVLGDWLPDSPEAVNLTLTSHIELYKALQTACARMAPHWSPSDAQRAVNMAEKSSGIHLSDSDLRRDFIALTRERIGPAAAAHWLVDQLRNQGLDLEIRNLCPLAATPTSLSAEPLNDDDAWLKLLCESACVIFASPLPDVAERAMESMLFGCHVFVTPTARVELDLLQPPTAFLTQLHIFDLPADAVQTLKFISIQKPEKIDQSPSASPVPARKELLRLFMPARLAELLTHFTTC